MTTLLGRAKGSALDITIDRGAPLDIMTPLSPHIRQIEHLTFPFNSWTDVLAMSEAISGPLPLLRTLKIRMNYNPLSRHNPNICGSRMDSALSRTMVISLEDRDGRRGVKVSGFLTLAPMTSDSRARK
jgi:hypothetical protein